MEAAQPAAQPETAQRLAHFGSGGELFAISLVNLLLKVVTLGIYHFWGKTRVRRYVWSHTGFAGERFEYVGRGIELLRGYIIAMVIFGPVLVGWQFLIEAMAGKLPVVLPVSLAGYAAFLFFSGLALFSSRRYLLSRTRWRGIRFGMSGSALVHGRKMLVYSLLMLITLGIYFPFMRSNLNAHIIGNTWFGDRQLAYAGRGRGLLLPFIRFALLNVLILGVLGFAVFGMMSAGAIDPTSAMTVVPLVAMYAAIGINWLWYRAREYRYFVENTALGEVRLRTDFRTAGYIWLWVSNVLLLALTVGLAYAWVVVRTARFLTEHLHLEGELDLAAIEQTSQQVPKGGEGLAEALDLGSI